MTQRDINQGPDSDNIRAFTKALLEDVQAIERMIKDGLIESGVRRIGAEQEMFLVDRAMLPAMKAIELMGRLKHPQFTTELGLFNLEVNLNPQPMGGDCLWRMEQELEGLLAQARRAADAVESRVLLTGILPTMKQTDLTLDAMTPEQRYVQLNRTMLAHRGGEFTMMIKGLDELTTNHDNLMFEACNTSFQIHFQVGAEEFAPLYNLAQAIAAPVLSAAVNSPVFLQHRLWSETRVALFQQSIDTRSEALQARRARPRVVFGDHWVKESVLEIFREDIARFRVLLATDRGESPLQTLDQGGLPRLHALQLHNGTIYRWNRPCYGVTDDKAHLRIEFRALPSGPTVIDEIANAAFFFGLMTALSEEYPDITDMMTFDDAKNNFMAACRYGLKARLQWVGGKTFSADELITDHLLPLAREGLKEKRVRSRDIDRYLGVLEARVATGRTGSQWILDSLADMDGKSRVEERYRALTAAMYARHVEGTPVHEWPLAKMEAGVDWRDSYRRVSQVMITDLFTLGPEDLVDLAANLMDWEHIRHVPVEDNRGRLVGLLSHRQLLRLVARGVNSEAEPVAIREIMTRKPVTVTPDTDTLEAIAIMRKHGVGCLPVVEGDNKLVGIVTEADFINMAAKLFEEELRDE
ncbi:MAG: CBS domain-containing protein [Candidatus Krumholzibacteria bacterium]|nr:CBS domain-containing protein [Candidatus Krumholzibacteria bacterium]